jgi:simple sugar transport system permease protein
MTMLPWVETSRLGLELAAPILLAALGECVVQRAGNLNLAIEGMLLTGCLGGALCGIVLGGPLATVGGAILGGVLLAAVFAWLVLWLGLDEVVTGTAMNLLAVGGTAVLWRAQLPADGSLLRVPVHGAGWWPALVEVPWLGAVLGDQRPLVHGTLLLVPLVSWYLFRSGPGLRLRACGEDPVAARAAGLPVRRLRLGALLFGGATAGAAGALLLADGATFREEMSAGRGFVALALVLFGRHRPVGCLLAALLFGGVMALQSLLQALPLLASPELKRMLPALFRSLPYALSLVVLAVFAGRSARLPGQRPD